VFSLIAPADVRLLVLLKITSRTQRVVMTRQAISADYIQNLAQSINTLSKRKSVLQKGSKETENLM
jgi:hypothetical protein